MHIDNITNKINGELQNYVRNGLKLYICKDDNYNVYMFTIVLDEIMLNKNKYLYWLWYVFDNNIKTESIIIKMQSSTICTLLISLNLNMYI